MILLFKCGCAFDFWQQLSWRLNLIVTYNTLCTGAGSDLLIPMLKKYNFISLTIRMVLVRVMWKWTGLSLKNHCFKMLRLSFCSKSCKSIFLFFYLLLNSFTSSVLLKLHPNKFEPLCLCKSTIRPRMEFCCRVWVGTSNC